MKTNKYLVFSAMGIELVGLIIASLYLGKWVDDTYKTKGLAMIGLSILSLAGWLIQIIQLSKTLEKKEGSKE